MWHFLFFWKPIKVMMYLTIDGILWYAKLGNTKSSLPSLADTMYAHVFCDTAWLGWFKISSGRQNIWPVNTSNLINS